jgi:hypothetical protein
MTREELRTIVKAHGGTGPFAMRLKVSQRIVQYWLAGKREVRPVIEDRIRSLKAGGQERKRNTSKKAVG